MRTGIFYSFTRFSKCFWSVCLPAASCDLLCLYLIKKWQQNCWCCNCILWSSVCLSGSLIATHKTIVIKHDLTLLINSVICRIELSMFESSPCKTWSILSTSWLGRLVLIITHTGGSYKSLYFSIFLSFGMIRLILERFKSVIILDKINILLY